MTTLLTTDIKSLPFLHRGKVRDIYAVDEDKLLVDADRPPVRLRRHPADDPIPGKGEVLTALSNFWFARLGHIMPNHLTGIAPEVVVSGEAERAQVHGRAMVVKKFKPLPIEAIVRGYIIGSGWKDYQKTGAVCGIALPGGPAAKPQKLPQPLFTPSTKAPVGEHDENISFAEAESCWQATRRAEVRDAALALYTRRRNTPRRAASSSPTPSSSSARMPRARSI